MRQEFRGRPEEHVPFDCGRSLTFNTESTSGFREGTSSGSWKFQWDPFYSCRGRIRAGLSANTSNKCIEFELKISRVFCRFSSRKVFAKTVHHFSFTRKMLMVHLLCGYANFAYERKPLPCMTVNLLTLNCEYNDIVDIFTFGILFSGRFIDSIFWAAF